MAAPASPNCRLSGAILRASEARRRRPRRQPVLKTRRPEARVIAQVEAHSRDHGLVEFEVDEAADFARLYQAGICSASSSTGTPLRVGRIWNDAYSALGKARSAKPR